MLFNKKSQLEHRGEHKHDLGSSSRHGNLWSAAESITKLCLEETETATYLSLSFPVKTSQNSLWWHLQTHDMPKRINFTNIQGETDDKDYTEQCKSSSYLPQMQV